MSESPIKENRIVQIATLAPHPRNYRIHPKHQIDQLALSLQRFGQGRSIVVQDAPEHPIIVAGHGIVEAAQALQWQELRADILPADWTDTQIEGYLIADNLHSQEASDNEELLAMLLQEQQDAGFDLATIGADDETLRQMLEAMGDGYLAGNSQEEDDEQVKRATLADRFIIPPFSVLDARQGYWQERKRAWIALGIQSELGRGESSLDFSASCVGLTDPQERAAWNAMRHADPKRMGGTPIAESNGGLSDQMANRGKKGLARSYGQDLMRGEHVVGENGKRLTWVAGDRPLEALDETSRKNLSGGRKAASLRQAGGGTLLIDQYRGKENLGHEVSQAGTSIFDPVLCELAYRWFSPPDGVVLDPFAGGSVRGIVAAKTGRQYVGLDLRQEQVEANQQQWESIGGISAPGGIMPVKVSAASARLLFHGCEPEYIRDVCHARCCESSSSPTGTLITIHPREESKIRERGGVIVDGLLQPRAGEKKCPFKTGENLCNLHFTPDKPFGCIASPFTLHASGDTLIIRNRYKTLICYNNDPKYGTPKPAYIAFRASFDLIFGKDEAERICTHLDSGGGDITAYVSKATYNMLRENDAIKKGHAIQDTPVDGQPTPRWIVGDSRYLGDFCTGIQADLIFTCPPYYDLEVYSDNPDDLSTVSTYSEFIEDYRAILKQAIAQLKDNRFVCLVVGDIRDKKGFYRNFVSDTITACQDAGAKLYNEAILVTSVGSLPIRVGKQFSSGRKLGKTHQNVLVFCKGDPRKAVEACGDVVVEVPEDEEEIAEEEEVVNA